MEGGREGQRCQLFVTVINIQQLAALGFIYARHATPTRGSPWQHALLTRGMACVNRMSK